MAKAIDYTLDQVEEMLEAQKENKFDFECKISDTAYENGMLKTPEGNLKVTEHSGAQMALRVKVPSGIFDWTFKNAPDECESIMQRHWKKYAEDHKNLSEKSNRMLVRGLNDGEDQIARAVLSGRYAVVDNLEIIQAMRLILPTKLSEIRFSGAKQSFFLDNDTLRLKVVMPADIDGIDPHTWGWLHTNSEIGAGSWRTLLALIRLECTNQLDLSSEDMIRIRHIGECSGLARILPPLTEALDKALDNSEGTFSSYYKLRDRKLNDPGETLKLLAPKLGIGKKLAAAIVNERMPKYIKETGYTAYSVVQAITEFARDCEDAAKQTFLQEVAGNIVHLTDKDWVRAN